MEKIFSLYVEFCKSNNLNFFFILILATIVIDVSYLPYIIDKNKFKKLKAYQKVLMFESYAATVIMIIAWLAGLSEYILQ